MRINLSEQEVSNWIHSRDMCWARLLGPILGVSPSFSLGVRIHADRLDIYAKPNSDPVKVYKIPPAFTEWIKDVFSTNPFSALPLSCTIHENN